MHILVDEWHSNFASQYANRKSKNVYLKEVMLIDMLNKIVNGLADL